VELERELRLRIVRKRMEEERRHVTINAFSDDKVRETETGRVER
jgi:hypothetical protein